MTRARMPRPHEVAAAQRDPRLLRAMRERDAGPGWRARGVCRSVDPETFFPAPSEPADAAVALCRTCQVQGACLAWALEVGDCHGVWGATTPRERRAMLVAWRAALAAENVPVSVGRPGAGPVEAPVPAVARIPVPAAPPIPAQSRGPMVATLPPAGSKVAALPSAAPTIVLEMVDDPLAGRFDDDLTDELVEFEGLVEHVPA